jgi:hypothetical protein
MLLPERLPQTTNDEPTDDEIEMADEADTILKARPVDRALSRYP